MTRDEFAAAADILDGCWPGEFTDADENSYFNMLDDFAVEDVVRALKALRRSKFRPSVPDLVTALTPAVAAAATFDEMFALLFSPRGALAARGVDGTRARLGELPELVAAFAERQGIQRLKELPVHDEDDGHWRRRDLRVAWEAHCEAVAQRGIAVMAAGRGPGELGRLDPLAGLGLQAQGALGRGA